MDTSSSIWLQLKPSFAPKAASTGLPMKEGILAEALKRRL
tara:strand:- start:911 stop:1030 length:120 start_codon:yes stop_codon:yes gene_type:complete